MGVIASVTGFAVMMIVAGFQTGLVFPLKEGDANCFLKKLKSCVADLTSLEYSTPWGECS